MYFIGCFSSVNIDERPARRVVFKQGFCGFYALIGKRRRSDGFDPVVPVLLLFLLARLVNVLANKYIVHPGSEFLIVGFFDFHAEFRHLVPIEFTGNFDPFLFVPVHSPFAEIHQRNAYLAPLLGYSAVIITRKADHGFFAVGLFIVDQRDPRNFTAFIALDPELEGAGRIVGTYVVQQVIETHRSAGIIARFKIELERHFAFMA